MYTVARYLLVLVVGLAAASSAAAAEVRLDPVGLTLLQKSEVPAQEAGPLVEVLVREGQHVTTGTLLARIDDQDAMVDVQRAKINLENARELADSDLTLRSNRELLKLAELEWNRTEDQLRRFPKTVSAAEIDRLGVDLARAKLDVEQAEQQRSTLRRSLQAAEVELRSAERGVARRRIVAPIDGVVVARNFRVGEWVEPGDKVIRLVNVRRLRAEGFLPANELPVDLLGRAATLVLAEGENERQEFAGRIVFVSPEANPVSGQVRIWAEVENPDGRLRPGLSGSLIIPEHAVDHQEISRRLEAAN